MRRNARSSVPWGAVLFGGLGVAALVRGLRHAQRYVLSGAYAQSCAGGSNCDPALTLQTQSGGQPVYAAAPGRVLSAGPNWVSLAVSDEAVVLDYSGFDQVQVAEHDRIGIGQQLGLASRLRFAVYSVVRGEDGGLRLGTAIEPAGWLATHGQAPSARVTPGHEGLWCEGRRALSVPQQVARCGIQLPQPTAWALLPVQVSLT